VLLSVPPLCQLVLHRELELAQRRCHELALLTCDAANVIVTRYKSADPDVGTE
jgi:hypothetical protein